MAKHTSHPVGDSHAQRCGSKVRKSSDALPDQGLYVRSKPKVQTCLQMNTILRLTMSSRLSSDHEVDRDSSDEGFD